MAGAPAHTYLTNGMDDFVPSWDIFPEKTHTMAAGRREVMHVRRQRERGRRRRAVPMRGMAEIRLLGVVMIAAGMVLLFLCIPGWAWAALIGAALVAAGYCLLIGGGR